MNDDEKLNDVPQEPKDKNKKHPLKYAEELLLKEFNRVTEFKRGRFNKVYLMTTDQMNFNHTTSEIDKLANTAEGQRLKQLLPNRKKVIREVVKYPMNKLRKEWLDVINFVNNHGNNYHPSIQGEVEEFVAEIKDFVQKAPNLYFGTLQEHIFAVIAEVKIGRQIFTLRNSLFQKQETHFQRGRNFQQQFSTAGYRNTGHFARQREHQDYQRSQWQYFRDKPRYTQREQEYQNYSPHHSRVNPKQAYMKNGAAYIPSQQGFPRRHLFKTHLEYVKANDIYQKYYDKQNYIHFQKQQAERERLQEEQARQERQRQRRNYNWEANLSREDKETLRKHRIFHKK